LTITFPGNLNDCLSFIIRTNFEKTDPVRVRGGLAVRHGVEWVGLGWVNLLIPLPIPANPAIPQIKLLTLPAQHPAKLDKGIRKSLKPAVFDDI